MSATSNFWRPDIKREFHQKVIKLQDWNREPYPPQAYRQRDKPKSDNHVLSGGVEQHIADHLAFLAQSEEGARTVSAATIEEVAGGNGMTVRIAANETPAKEVLEGLTKIGKVVEMYVAEGKSRKKYCEMMFDLVVEFSTQRIHERLRDKSSPRPWWVPAESLSASKYKPLFSRVRDRLQTLKTSLGRDSQESNTLFVELEGLAQAYEDIDNTESKEQQHELLKRAVRKSYAISTATEDNKSLGEHLKSLRLSREVYESREVLEIDKIARYLVLCEDFIRFSRRYGPLFRNIRFTYLESPPRTKPDGADSVCHVHGEVQLVLYYEQYPHYPPPRAIGSSKSACLLCDLFIKKHGQYHISHSHKRLHPKWTIPDVNWMTQHQVVQYRRIVRTMIAELTRLRDTSPRQRVGYFNNGIESRVHLLSSDSVLSAASTSSILPHHTGQLGGPPTPPVTPQKPSQTAGIENIGATRIIAPMNASQDTETTTSFDTGFSISLSQNDLPYSQPISLTSPSLYVEVESVSFSLDFLKVRHGQISVAQTENGLVLRKECNHIKIAEIPTTSEMLVNCMNGSNELFIYLQSDQDRGICFEFVWDAVQHSD